MSNKKIGNDFETEFCELLSQHGFWCHNFAVKSEGQPADVIAVRNKESHLIDCKVCSTKKGFTLSRMEENQILAMTRWKECGNGQGWFALKANDEVYMLSLDVLIVTNSRGSIPLSAIPIVATPFEEWVKRCK